ncbi:MAG: DNA mismatch repair endonuclease MutL [Paraglaciecola sp.]|nr:DNA mismatch repair endonuclease MutL [Paraglaciecola sp.]
MPIQILPARLANQIAAGEVVERPASVVKELIENSLDSGASQIDIEIEKGGHKRIVIRDNGSGIPQAELGLALSRHATSKISSLDELEHIASLGFRGEALASISSVARLSLSSKPAEQHDAWQAQCEGRDMEVNLTPVAHPNGTSVEVLDLFFNTPARRKFLRAEKTEFTHIDEIIRRIALSRFDVGFSLKHNGKVVRKYSLAENEQAKKRRLVAICGKDFSEQAIELNSQYQDFCLSGWLAPPDTAKPQVDCQYFYVNGRMMRDKLLNHAVRQALEGVISPEHQLAYVLYFNLELSQVDVNVHPAKHEVRFHQSRLVHDFIFRALSDALNQYFNQSRAANHIQDLPPVVPNHDYMLPLTPEREPQVNEVSLPTKSLANLQGFRRYQAPSGNDNRPALTHTTVNLGQASQAYQALMTSSVTSDVSPNVDFLRVSEHHLLIKKAKHFYILAITALIECQLMQDFAHGMPVSQPLLLPISIEADAQQLAHAGTMQAKLAELNIDIAWQGKRIILRKIPAGMREFDWSVILERLLNVKVADLEALKQCLASNLALQQSNVSDNDVLLLWQKFCQQATKPIEQQLALVAKKVPFQQWLTEYVR